MKRILIIGLFIMLGSSCILSQNTSLDLDLFGGRIWKHKEELYYQTPPFTAAIQLSYFRPLKSSVYWDRAWNYPEIGLSALYLSFGDGDVLGDAVGILPGIKFNLFERNDFQLELYNGFGLAWLSTTFNEINNPSNNAIGSHINNVSKIALGIRKQFTNWSLKVGGDFTHFSNGGSQSPNSGINIVTGSIGVSKNFAQTERRAQNPSPADTLKRKRSMGLSLSYHYGVTEDDIPNGPKYPIRAISLAWFKHFSPRYRILAGLEYEENMARYHFSLNTFSTEDEARERSKQMLIILANEFFIVNYSFRLQTGFYTHYPTDFGNGSFYFKLISQYHFKLPDTLPVNKISLGIMMKSHWAKAENIGLVIGIDI